MNIKTTIFIIVIITATAIVFHGNPKTVNAGIIHSIPPIEGEMLIIGEYIYFAHDMNLFAKHAKSDLSEIDTLEITTCLNFTYSDYLDRIILHADFDPSKLIVINYQDMTIDSETEVNQRISGICASGDKLYITIDGWALPFGSYYLFSDMPKNTGILRELNLDDMSLNWEVNIGTMPNYEIDAGDYVATMGYEVKKDEEYRSFQGSIVSIVDKSTQDVRQFIAGPGFDTHMEYDGVNKIYISNPNGAYATDKPAGISILHLDTWEMEHVVLEKPDPDVLPWKVDGTCINGDYLYMAYFNSKYEDKTYFGIMDTTTGEYENIELPDISQYLTSVEVDGNNIYFSTLDGWLVKYTPD